MIVINQERIDGLVSRPGESLNVEVKRWINPDDPSGAAKIVRGAFAIRNRNGGFFIVGFDDKTLKPDVGNAPANVRALFHLDKIQGLISRYVLELFEIGVGFGSRDGQEYPVIVIPEGVQVPAVAKRPLIDGQNQALISLGDVYFRTLQANGTPSTSLARPEDWREILEICFENREANIGRFLRRHLTGQDLGPLIAALGATAATASPTLREQADALLADGEQRFARALQQRTLALTTAENALVEALTWHVALVIDPLRPDAIADQTFLATVASSNPNLTGWPVWLDARFNTDERTRPVVRDNGWETLILSRLMFQHIDFDRLDPSGKFYLRRLLQDDARPDRVPPGSVLDPILAIQMVAEAMIVGLAFARGLGWDPGTTRLGFAFQWTNLKGRVLESWSNPYVTIPPRGSAAEDQIRTYVEVPLDTPAAAIAPAVDEATRRLFALFAGYRMPTDSIEEWIRRLIERRLT
jgi:hypothetical protein